VPAFVAAQLAAVVAAIGLVKVLYPDIEEVADRVVVPREADDPIS